MFRAIVSLDIDASIIPLLDDDTMIALADDARSPLDLRARIVLIIFPVKLKFTIERYLAALQYKAINFVGDPEALAPIKYLIKVYRPRRFLKRHTL